MTEGADSAWNALRGAFDAFLGASHADTASSAAGSASAAASASAACTVDDAADDDDDVDGMATFARKKKN